MSEKNEKCEHRNEKCEHRNCNYQAVPIIFHTLFGIHSGFEVVKVCQDCGATEIIYRTKSKRMKN